MWKQGNKIIDTGVISIITHDGREVELSNSCSELIVEDNVQSFADYKLTSHIETTCKAQHFIGIDYFTVEDISSITLTGYAWTTVQAKTHKKKRINKKWLKRYGMKDVRIKKTYVSDNVTFKRDDREYTNDFLDRSYKVEMSNMKEV